LTVTGEAETGNRHHVFHGRIVQVIVFYLLDHFHGAAGAGTAGNWMLVMM